MALQESGEMYLETIYVLGKANPQVRSIDISEHMGYSKPSVSRAVRLLKNGGFITAPAQEIQADVPFENLCALIDTANALT